MDKIYCIVLTTFNESVRTKMYVETINWWLENTDIDIYVIDSSNKGFPEIKSSRVQIYQYDQEKISKNIVEKYSKPSLWELWSLNNFILENETKLLRYKYIIKITGKYRLPGFKKAILSIDKIIGEGKHTFIIQNKKDHDFSQNTELLGIRSTDLKTFISTMWKDFLCQNVFFEKMLQSYINRTNASYIRLSPIKIPVNYQMKRNDGSILSYL